MSTSDGLQQEWIDSDDRPQRVDDAVIERLREVIGEPPADLEQTAPLVTRPGRSTGLRGRVTCEDGSARDLDDVVPEDFPLGYHRLAVEGGAERLLVVSPGRCFVPEEQRWGLAAQLYAVWSARSAGIGDLGDLRRLREWTASLGGGFLVVNPLHAVAPVLPLEASPYLPATRRFRNPVYLDLDAVPGVVDGVTPGAAEGEPRPPAGVVDRDAAWSYKLPALRAVWDAGLAADAAADLAAYRLEQGQGLEQFATWCVLAAEHGADFHDWPAELRDPCGDAVTRLAHERGDEVGFWAWLQWLLARQLAEATGEVTVIQDLPIGVDGGGADAWVWQEVLADGVSVGAPPDALNSVGQSWGSPPLVPWRLRAADYGPFIESVRATIAGAGGLRIDHVMGLFRLWWIPEGAKPTEGCYVRYPADDLLDIVCLESHRAGAIVVGEDLGTVEDGVAEALAERGILGYRVLLFEDDDPAEWALGTLAAATTHDLATIAGLWTGSDVDDQLAALGSGVDPDDVRAGREELLERVQAPPEGAALGAGSTVDDALVAVHTRLGRAASVLVSVSLDDVVGQERRPNVPGTTSEQRDNWCVPLPVALDDLPDHPRPPLVLGALWSHRSE